VAGNKTGSMLALAGSGHRTGMSTGADVDDDAVLDRATEISCLRIPPDWGRTQLTGAITVLGSHLNSSSSTVLALLSCNKSADKFA
jgi:hypothetical protein